MYKYENCVYHKSSKIWHAFKADNGNKIELYENGRYKFIESNLNKIHMICLKLKVITETVDIIKTT